MKNPRFSALPGLKSFFLPLVVLCFLLSTSNAQQQGIPSDGKDFYIGFIFPSFNINPPSSAGRNVAGFFNVLVLITSYEPNNIVKIAYFDASGREVTAVSKLVGAKQGFSVALDKSAMQMTKPGDTLEFKACHITAKKPVNVQYFSTGANSGGSYLALPTNALGKSYVIASYNDNPGNGAYLIDPADHSGGFFDIIAPFDNTKVKITPNGVTAGGHIAKQPYTITLQRGQCYWVKGDGDNQYNDLSGSLITSDKPIAVLAGHEEALLGSSNGYGTDARDFMVEEMVPVEYLDNKGYVSIPLKSTTTSSGSDEGYGDHYRTYTADSNGAHVTMFNAGGSPSDANTPLFAHPQQSNVNDPVDFTSSDGHLFSVMLYDPRQQNTSSPNPAPSMMTIVPMKNWRTSFLLYVPPNTFEVLQNYYINVIALKNDLDKQYIKYGFNGGALQALTKLTSKATYTNIPNHPELKGATYSVSPGTYYLTNTRDAYKNPDKTDANTYEVDSTILHGAFMVYHYGMRAIDPDRDIGDFDGDDFFFEYALPIGMNMSSPGGNPKLTKVDTLCGSWHICVKDSTGITSITLLDDPDGNFYRPGKQLKNVRFDPALDPEDKKEINLDGHDTAFCFDIFVSNPLDTAYAPLYIVNSKGRHIEPIPEFRYQPPHVFLANQETPSQRIDSLKYPFMNVGKEVCSTLVYINTAGKGGKSVIFNSVLLRKNDGAFKIILIVPAVPTVLKPGDTLKVNICFNPKDTLFYEDSLIIRTPCFDAPLPIVGSGGTPIIYATDIDFGDVVVGGTTCKELTVSNRGKLPFILTKNWLLHDTSVFSMDPTYAGYLPHTLMPGEQFKLVFCYTPKSLHWDSTIVDWNTNIEQPFTNQLKSWSYLRGNPIKPFVKWDREKAFFIPDTTAAIDSIILRVHLINSGTARTHVNTVTIIGASASEFKIVDNQLGYSPFSNFDIRVRDSIWVDVLFKPDLTKPYPERYEDRICRLIAAYDNPVELKSDTAKLILIGTWNKNDVKQSLQQSTFTIRPNPVTGTSIRITFASAQKSKAELAIYDVLGREVYKTDILQGISQLEVPIRNLPKGTYFARLTSESTVATQKFEITE